MDQTHGNDQPLLDQTYVKTKHTYMTCPDVDTRVLNQNPIASPICDMLNQHERIPAKAVCKTYEQQK